MILLDKYSQYYRDMKVDFAIIGEAANMILLQLNRRFTKGYRLNTGR